MDTPTFNEEDYQPQGVMNERLVPPLNDFDLQGEKTLTVLAPIKCEHYLIRKKSTEFGCTKCTNNWIDNGEFQFSEGKFVGYFKRPV